MSHLVKIIIFFFLISSGFLLSQVVESFDVSGNSAFSDSEYREWSEISNGLKLFQGMMDSIKTRIAYQLGSRGYLHVEFDNESVKYSSDSQMVAIEIEITEGEPTFVRKININGLDSITGRYF
jgi:outer membrane protein assembly factor BamA